MKEREKKEERKKEREKKEERKKEREKERMREKTKEEERKRNQPVLCLRAGIPRIVLVYLFPALP